MPAAINYIEPNNIKRKDLGGDDERRSRQKEYNRNLKFYSGKHPEWLIQQMDDPVNDNITVNVTKQAVDRTLSFLFPDLPIFQLDPNEQTDDETWLNAAWRINGGAYFLALLAQNGALSGHNYIKILPPKDSISYPRLIALNPSVPITYWRVDDPDTVLWHEMKWQAGKTEMLQDYINNQDGTWAIHQFQRQVGVNRWTPIDQIAWNSDIPPVVGFAYLPNPNYYYGIPEVTENSIDLNNSINRIASDIGKILRYHASPKTIGIGITADKIQPGSIENFYTIDDKDARIMNLEMKSDLASSMAFLQYLNDMFLSLSRVVILRGSVKDFQRVTNTGIRAVFLDMIAKNELLRWTYGIGLQRVCQVLLYVGGRASNVLPTITWPDPLPADELETVNKLQIEQANGWVDPETVSKKLGYEWATVVAQWSEARNNKFIEDLLFAKKQTTTGTKPAQTSNNKVAP